MQNHQTEKQLPEAVRLLNVGAPLNGLVVWAGSNEETRAASSFRVYVLNLALADLVLILRTPLMLGFLIHNSWPFGDTFCRIIMFLRVLGLYASAFLLCAVALERCLCLLRPVWARLRRPAWAVPLACGLIWLMATILSSPYLYFAVLQEKSGKHLCYESEGHNTTLFVIETLAGFMLPVLVFLGSNLAVLLTIRRMIRMYHVLFFTMLLFLTCWVPYFVCRFIQALAKSHSLFQSASYGKYISLYLVYIKSALNPVLYVFAARGLGRAIKASLSVIRYGSGVAFQAILDISPE
uniref:C5a anaphylatoxin chemotactic receptor 1-like n=1 Tax=Pundamilia nyererei TaxID=303518 RepID=A0A3B4F2I2_9CICH